MFCFKDIIGENVTSYGYHLFHVEGALKIFEVWIYCIFVTLP